MSRPARNTTSKKRGATSSRPVFGASERAAARMRGTRTEREVIESRTRAPKRKVATRAADARTKRAPVEETPLFPMRINKYLAHKGIATRRDADELIAKKTVLINGQIAQIGDRVTERDHVELRKHVRPTAYAYIAFNKPAGMDTHREETGTPNIFDSLPSDLKRMKLFPVGRLDKASRGLIILTNDGRITDRLLNPAYAHEKTYEVKTKAPLRESFKEAMERGVNIEEYETRPADVKILAENRFRATITEGKTHQIRRMVVALHNEVADLKRTRIMNIELGNLPVSGWRPIEGEELATFMRALGLGQ